MKRVTLQTLALIVLLPLAACGRAPQTDAHSGAAQTSKDAGDSASHSMISREIEKAMEHAKHELATRNIDVNDVHLSHGHSHGSSLPRAEITPQGALLIAGKNMNATPAQQVLLMDYRKQILGIAEAGIDIGTQGADLGIQAGKAALWGALGGKSDEDVKAAIKPQADRIQAAALQLCKRLPELLSSQQKLAAAMPAFQPYATMEQKDVDDCGKEMADKNGKKGFAIFSD